MKKKYFLLLIIIFNVVVLKAQDVYKTPSGKKYHLGSCHMVNNVSEKITVSEAVNLGLGPCGICYPDAMLKGIPGKAQTASGQDQTVQCKGYTKKGRRCQHMTSIANGFCYQHGPNK